MTTPLPEYLDALNWYASGGESIDEFQRVVEAYGAAEYQRGIEDAKAALVGKVGAGTPRKLGEKP